MNKPTLTHVQSEETISPEDEVEDPMEKMLDGLETPAKASPLPVRSGEYLQESVLNLLILQHREPLPLYRPPHSEPRLEPWEPWIMFDFVDYVQLLSSSQLTRLRPQHRPWTRPRRSTFSN